MGRAAARRAEYHETDGLQNRTRGCSFITEKLAANRKYFWQCILESIQGASPDDDALLRASMVIDLQDQPEARHGAMPICRFACTVVLPGLDARFRIRAGSDDLYLVLPYREGDVHEAILGSLRPGQVFVDAGANIGYYAVLASRLVGESGRVVAVEPHPGTAAQLRENLALNGCKNVEVRETALWSTSGETLRLKVTGGVYGEAQHSEKDCAPADEMYLVPTSTLDEICRPFPRIGTIKLDIEGSEVHALRGAAETLAKTDRLVVECFWQEEEIADLLAGSGFSLTRLSFGHHLLAKAAGV